MSIPAVMMNRLKPFAPQIALVLIALLVGVVLGRYSNPIANQVSIASKSGALVIRPIESTDDESHSLKSGSISDPADRLLTQTASKDAMSRIKETIASSGGVRIYDAFPRVA